MFAPFTRKPLRLAKPECLSWQALPPQSTESPKVRRRRSDRVDGYEEMQRFDDEIIIGCDGMQYSSGSHAKASTSQPRSLAVASSDANEELVTDGLHSHWLCLGGEDIPELDEDEDFVPTEPDTDDEETLDVEDSLPCEVTANEDLALLNMTAEMELDRLCCFMNVPREGSEQEAPLTELVEEQGPRKLIIRCHDTVFESIMEGDHFGMIHEHRPQVATVMIEQNEPEVVTTTQTTPQIIPDEASEKMFVLLHQFNDLVLRGACEDALRFAIRRFALDHVEEAITTRADVLRRRIRQSDDFAFVYEPKMNKAKDAASRTMARLYEQAEGEAPLPLEDNRKGKSSDSEHETLLLQPIMRRLLDKPLIPRDGLDINVWRARNTYCELLRLQASVAFLRCDEEAARMAERHRCTFVFMTRRFPILSDHPHNDRQTALQLMAANKEHTLRCIGRKAWNKLFPEDIEDDSDVEF